MYSLVGQRVFVAGHRGMVGSALLRRLTSENCEIITVQGADVDLRRQADVETWLHATKPDVIFLAAATVGGILANSSKPAQFIYDNLVITTNVIEGAKRIGVVSLFLGSSCIYPRLAPTTSGGGNVANWTSGTDERMVRTLLKLQD